MKKILIITTFIIFFLTQFLFSQDENRRSKIWSKIATEPVQEKVEIDINYQYKPLNIEPKYIKLQNSFVRVSPNFRPLPTTNTTQSEMSIDVHPLDPNIIFGSANTTNWTSNGVTNTYGTGVYFSHNKGKNWIGSDDPSFGWNAGDPASIIGTNGYFYEGFIDGGENDLGQGIVRSTDFGNTWTRYVVAPGPKYPDLLDKNHLWIDKQVGSPYENRLYSAWTKFQIGDPNDLEIELRYSIDFGETWSESINISQDILAGSHNQGVNISSGQNGEVYTVWAIYDDWPSTEDAIGFNKSFNGGVDWVGAKRIFNNSDFGIRGELKSSKIRVNSFPSMAVDRSDGPNNGNIYVVWTQRSLAPAGNDPDIVLIKSTDGGESWSEPVRVNDDPLNNYKDQYFPWCTVDQTTGYLYIVFYDSRNTSNDSSEIYIAKSMDGGNTFENILVSDSKFQPRQIPGLSIGYQGDYIGIAASNNTVFPFWCDNRTNIYQGWMAEVSFAPSIEHTPLTFTENMNGPFKIEATIQSPIPINYDKVFLYWGTGEGIISDSIKMINIFDSLFTAEIPGTGIFTTYNYYIKVEDEVGGTSTYPFNAPSNYFSFRTDIDTIPPLVQFTPLTNQFRETWPAVVEAVVSDSLGIDSVWVNYKLNSDGISSSFKLNYDSLFNKYYGEFNIDTSVINVGDTLFYRIIAKDLAQSSNYTYLPSINDFYNFIFIVDTLKPEIVHIPLTDKILMKWPVKIKAYVNDNIEVSDVKVEYFINDNLDRYTFSLNNIQDSLWEGSFLNYPEVQINDIINYRIIAIDNTTSSNQNYLPENGFYNFKILETKGKVLVINDDNSLTARFSENNSEREGLADRRTPLGYSSNIFVTTLDDNGFFVDTTTFSFWQPSNLQLNDFIILSAGTKSNSIFDEQSKRDSLINFVKNGGTVWVEGGDVGYYYRYKATDEIDKDFRRIILNDSLWLSDYNGGKLTPIDSTDSLFVYPNNINNPISFYTNSPNYAYRDVVRLMPNKPNVKKLAGWETQFPDTAGIIVSVDENNPYKIKTIYFTFSVSQIDNQEIAAQLIENTSEYIINGLVTDIQDDEYSIAQIKDYSLSQNYPNPFNPTTKIKYTIPIVGNQNPVSVKLKIYNIMGQEIATLVNEIKSPGEYEVEFNGKGLSSGIYFYKLEAGSFVSVKKMILLK